MPGVSREFGQELIDVVDIVRNDTKNGVAIDRHGARTLVKRFELSEDLKGSEGSAEAKLLTQAGDGSWVEVTPAPEDSLKVYLDDIPTDKKIPTGSKVWAVKYGKDWQVISFMGCFEDDPGEE